jgi:hypothetical protein
MYDIDALYHVLACVRAGGSQVLEAAAAGSSGAEPAPADNLSTKYSIGYWPPNGKLLPDEVCVFIF